MGCDGSGLSQMVSSDRDYRLFQGLSVGYHTQGWGD